MAKDIWNEGRVVGYSAYEMYVKTALAKGVTPATEQQWLASSLAMGASMLLQLTEDDTPISSNHVDIPLPADCRLRAANTIYASLFFGEATFTGGSESDHWLHNVVAYGEGPRNSDALIGDVHTYTDFYDYSGNAVEIWIDRTRNYSKLLDGCIYQAGTWSPSDVGFPESDMSPILSDVPHIRIWYDSPLTAPIVILLTGFTDSGVIAGCVDTRGSVDSPNHQDGDYLGPAVFPWSAKVVFTAPTFMTKSLLEDVSTRTSRIEDTIEKDAVNESYSEWHVGVLYPELWATDASDTGSAVLNSGKIVDVGDPMSAIDFRGAPAASYSGYHRAPDMYAVTESRLSGFNDADNCHAIRRMQQDAYDSETYLFAYPRPDAIPHVDVISLSAGAGYTDEYDSVAPSFRMLGKVSTVVYNGDTALPQDLSSVITAGNPLKLNDIIISDVPYPIPCVQTTPLVTDTTNRQDDPDIAILGNFDAVAEGQIIRDSTSTTYIKSPAVINGTPISATSIRHKLRYIGETTTPIQNGATTTPVVIDGESISPQTYDIVTYNNLTFVWDETTWRSTYGWQVYQGVSQSKGVATYREQYFKWTGAKWEAFHMSGAPDTGRYNASRLNYRCITTPSSSAELVTRVLGDSTTAPSSGVTINGELIPFSDIDVGDIVRYRGTCYIRISSGSGWAQYDCPELMINVWGQYNQQELPYRWRLRWEIPGDKGVEL